MTVTRWWQFRCGRRDLLAHVADGPQPKVSFFGKVLLHAARLFWQILPTDSGREFLTKHGPSFCPMLQKALGEVSLWPTPLNTPVQKTFYSSCCGLDGDLIPTFHGTRACNLLSNHLSFVPLPSLFVVYSHQHTPRQEK